MQTDESIRKAKTALSWLPLLRETLDREGRFRWRLQGSSMLPTLAPGAEIEIEPLPAYPPLGALLVFLLRDDWVAHRLVHRSRSGWITQGDGCIQPDPPLAFAQALGIVTTAYTPNGERCWPGRWPQATAAFWVARYWALRGKARLAARLERWR